MFKQMFNKFFKSIDNVSALINTSNGSVIDENNNNNNSNRSNDMITRRPIYAIPTISSCFQQSSENLPPSLANYYTSTNNGGSSDGNNKAKDVSSKSSQKSTSSYSSTFSTSSSSSSSSSSSKSSSNIKESFGATSINKSTTSIVNKNTPKFNETNVHQIYIAPHCIRYTNSTLDDTIYRIDDDSLNEIAAEILESENCPPKLQIVFYAGKYYAINNSHLQVYKQLQLSGLITHVQADVISVEAIPFALRQHLLQTPSQTNSNVNSNEISDDDYMDDYDPNAHSNCSSSSVISSNGGIADILSADILSPNTIELLSKDVLVDETYEFGSSENCLESDNETNDTANRKHQKVTSNSTVANHHDDDDDDDDENDGQDDMDDDEENSSSSAADKINSENSSTQSDKREISEILKEEIRLQQQKWKKFGNKYDKLSKGDNEAGIMENIKDDEEWKKYEELCSMGVDRPKTNEDTNKVCTNKPKKAPNRRQNTNDKSNVDKNRAVVYGNQTGDDETIENDELQNLLNEKNSNPTSTVNYNQSNETKF